MNHITSFNIENLKNSFDTLILNIISDKIVNFLNLNISLCNLTGKLLYSIYFKPTNVFSYLLTTSNHPKHIFKNIPYGMFLTIRRICTNFSDFLYFSRKLHFHMLKRGYDGKILQKVANSVGKLNRDQLLPYKIRDKSNIFNNNFLFKIPFEMNLDNDILDLNSLFRSCINTNSKISNFKLKIIYSKQFSVGDIFINSFKDVNFKFNFKKCNLPKCLTCFFMEKNNIKMLRNFPLIMKSNSNCKSSCIYLISCKRCNDYFYVGQTNCIRDRFYRHIRDITKFVKFKVFSSVSTHFNLNNHDIFRDLSIFIIKSFDYNHKERDFQKELNVRLANENYYMYLLKTMNFNLMNDDFQKLSNLQFSKCLDIIK